MPNKAYTVLQDIFTNQINVLNIAVPTEAEDFEKAKNVCQKNNYDVHLVKEEKYEDLKVYNRKKDNVQLLHNSDVITESTPLLEVFDILSEKEYIFVKVKRDITHIVTRANLDTIPVRICLYGMISLFEKKLKQTIKDSNIHWEKLISAPRLKRAKDLYEEKKQSNEEISLLNCTQLADIKNIVIGFWGKFKKYFPTVRSKN